jgi:ATP-dependent DNA helicase RecG
LIEQGESNTLEFKRQIEARQGNIDEFVESIVAFANAKGGIILLGVDDDTTIHGLSDKDSEERISSIVRSHCIPEPKYECMKRMLGEKEILLIKVEEGSDKPYTVWQKGIFIRAGSSDRIAERYELDEIYRQKTGTSIRSID